MEEQSTWKSHTFTLMIFGGIVVLCSIFFVLGMLVGRAQTVKLTTVASADAAPKTSAKASPAEDLADKDPGLDPALVKPVPLPPAPSKPTPAAKATPEELPAVPPAMTINLQISALKNQSDAEKLVDELKKKGFRAFILTPAPSESTPFYRVQIGAADQVEAESLKRKLEAAGYKGAMIKK